MAVQTKCFQQALGGTVGLVHIIYALRLEFYQAKEKFLNFGEHQKGQNMSR